MSKAYIPDFLRQHIAERARNRCGYCQTQAEVIGQALQIDHIIPESAGGPSDSSNLWLACVPCNQIKGSRTMSTDPGSGKSIPLFNPVTQVWHKHFKWSEDGTVMIGQTSICHATIQALRLNRDLLVLSRKRWVLAGWHPPKEQVAKI